MDIYYYSKLEKILNKEVIDIFINVIHTECKNIRKPKYSTEYLLYYIILVLTDLQKWSSLSLILLNDIRYHYSIIKKTHLKWSKLNIYKKVYNILLEKYKLNNLKLSKNMVLFIDSANIYNKNGSEKVGYGQNPKKKESRISLICDSFRNIYSLTLIDTYNNKNNKNNNKKRKNKKKALKTLPHDSTTIQSSLNDLVLNNIKYKTLYIVADSGYATLKENKEILYNNYNVKLAYPHKKNQKIKTSKKDKKLLINRYIVENTFAHIKNFSRICMRQDKLKITYMGFVFLGAILKFKK
jgi:hypothetical protein